MLTRLPPRLAAIAAVLTFLAAPSAHAATTDKATAAASPAPPYLVGQPITFTSTTPCTVACRLIWTYLNGTRLGDKVGEGTSVVTSFATVGLHTVQLDLSELCVGTTRINCHSFAYVSVPVGAPPPVADTTPPTIAASGLQAEATGPNTVVNYSFAASDPDDAVAGQACSPAPGEAFPLGTTPVQCTAVDSNGNIGTASFAVVVRDTTAPALTLPAALSVEASSAAGAVVTYSATASDLVDGALSPTCSMPSGATFAPGPTTVTCSAVDASGNRSTGSFVVDVMASPPMPADPPPPPPPPLPPVLVVVDSTPPTVSVPSAIVVDATSPGGVVVRYTVSATDSGSAVAAMSCSKAAGSMFSIGSTTVTCTATDAMGNTTPPQAFVVHVKGSREQLVDTRRQVLGWKVRGHALSDRLTAAIRAVSRQDRACVLLGGIRSELRGALGKGLTPAQRAVVRADLARIRNVVGCAR